MAFKISNIRDFFTYYRLTRQQKRTFTTVFIIVIILIVGGALYTVNESMTISKKPDKKTTVSIEFDEDKPFIIDHGNGVAFIYLGNLPGSQDIPYYAEKFETPFAKWKKDYPLHAERITGITTSGNDNDLYIVLYSTEQQ